MSEGGKISQKIKVWFCDYFNVSDFLAILMFFVGFGLRFGSGSVFIAGRIVYCLNIIFWYVRLLDILAVNQQAGPYVMMIGKMVSERSELCLCLSRSCPPALTDLFLRRWPTCSTSWSSWPWCC